MKKAFTLVELLAVIILLGLLGLIIYPTVNGVINTNKQKLHDKQIEELIRHVDTYATTNISKLNTNDGAVNIVTFTDLYEAGIIQNDKVVDPSNDEELTGCMALTWNYQRQSFDIEYDEKCLKSASLTGTITGEYADSVDIYLAQGYEAMYKTQTDASGNYSFNGIMPGRYVLVAVKNTKTKYGVEVTIDKETNTKNMAITLYGGDFNNNNIVNKTDRDFGMDCINSYANDSVLSKCLQNGMVELDFDLDGNSSVTLADRTQMTSLYSINRISQITLSGTAKLSGKVTNYGKSSPTFELKNNDTSYTTTMNSDGTFTFENIPRGSYVLRIKKSGWLMYSEYVYLDKDISGISATFYPGDVWSDHMVNDQDIEEMEYAIANQSDLTAKEKTLYDLNEDGVIDKKDLAIVQANLGRVSNVD